MKSLRDRLTKSYILVALAGILLASVVGAILVRTVQVRAAERSVRLLTAVVASRAEDTPRAPINRRALQQLSNADGVRVLHVTPEGEVLADSQDTLVGDRLPLGNLLRVVERATGDGSTVHRARVEGRPHFFSVVPVGPLAEGNRLVIAVPVASVLDSSLLLLPGMLLMVLVGVGLAAFMARRHSQQLISPVHALTEAAEKVAKGDYDVRVEANSEIAELQTLGRTFNTMADEVQTARQGQRDFLANVSHDLRTPLTSIQGFSQALMDGAVPESQTPRVANIIYTEASRLTRLVQDLLDLARIEAGRFSMAQQDVNLKNVLQQCSEKFGAQAETMGVQFEANIPRRPMLVHGDADRLEQVVTNLVDNALTYAQDGGGHVKLVGKLGGIQGAARGNGHTPKEQPEPSASENGSANGNANGHSHGEQANGHANGHVTSAEEDSTRKLGRWWIEIQVSDDGPGIADEHKPLVFDRFYRADTARSGVGTGLGLAIAREIVTAHGGDITIEDSTGGGTQFIVRLPMKMR